MVKAEFSFIKTIWQGFRGGSGKMRRRLLVYLLFLMFTMVAGVVFLLSAFGVSTSGAGEMGKLFSSELVRLSDNISKQYGTASVQAMRMSDQLSASIADAMKRKGISTAELKSHPELLEPLFKDLLFILLVNLYSAEFSGAFVTLDTTVNPHIPGAENSKAGLYIRNIEPNIGGTGTETRYLLRGFPSLANDGYINFQSKWDLEFNVKDQLFWMEPLKAHVTNPSLPLSRLMHWCSMSPVQGLNESVMICSIPLLDDARRILGVCGFEISEMNFMLRHGPNIDGFHNAVFLFSCVDDGRIRLEDALFSGNNALYNVLRKQGSLSVTGSAGEFSLYGAPGTPFVGMEKTIRLYPNGSPFAGVSFAAALVMPLEDYNAVVSASRRRLILIGAILLCVGVALSLFLSERSEKPFKELLEALRSGDMSAKSQIQEIDDLLEFMRSQLNETRATEDESAEKSSESSQEHLLDSFIENTKKLSRAEAGVFNLYLEGYSVDEIASRLSISINTLKTHNRRIYTKLNVSSKKELLTWIQLLTASERSSDDLRKKQFEKIRNIVSWNEKRE